jgi:hypothetical protein
MQGLFAAGTIGGPPPERHKTSTKLQPEATRAVSPKGEYHHAGQDPNTHKKELRLVREPLPKSLL